MTRAEAERLAFVSLLRKVVCPECGGRAWQRGPGRLLRCVTRIRTPAGEARCPGVYEPRGTQA